MNIRPVLYITGILLSILAVSMAIPMLVDLYYGSPDWRIFFLCIMVTSFFGGALVLSNSSETHVTLTIRQAFMLTGLSWFALALFGAFPFWICQLDLNFTDAFFESMSGITTTGATVITGLDGAPPGILLWRAILQWLGGIGIIVMSLAVLPFLRIGGMQIFYTDTGDQSGKALPRTAKLANAFTSIYVFLTLACATCYYIAGMGFFDSVAHAMATVSTGGFSTFDTSFQNLEGLGMRLTAILFMILGGVPFVLYLKAVRGEPKALLKDDQIRWFLGILSLSVLTLFLYFVFFMAIQPSKALMDAAFNVTARITGTGFSVNTVAEWSGFPLAFLFFLALIGGCAGSTASGIKIFRFQILYTIAIAQIKKLLHPHGIFLAHYNGSPLPDDVPSSVMGFLSTYAIGFVCLAALLSLTGLDFSTAISGAAAAIANAGFAFGEMTEASGTFKDIPDSAKWIISAGMLFGRLELFTLLVLFSRDFWRK